MMWLLRRLGLSPDHDVTSSKTGIVTLPLQGVDLSWCPPPRFVQTVWKLSSFVPPERSDENHCSNMGPSWNTMILERQRSSHHMSVGGISRNPKYVLLSIWTFTKRVIELGRGGRYGGRLRWWVSLQTVNQGRILTWWGWQRISLEISNGIFSEGLTQIKMKNIILGYINWNVSRQTI